MIQVRFDDTTIQVTDEFVRSLKRVMVSVCKMMSAHEGSECWKWGRCTITNLSRSSGIQFEYGGNDTLPDDGLGKFAVVVTP